MRWDILEAQEGDAKRKRIPNSVTLYSHLFKLDLVMMSIVILCILSAMLYQGIAWLEKKVL